MTDERIQITERFWSPAQVAESLNVHHRTVRRWCRAGLLGHVRAGHLIRVSDGDLKRFLSRIHAEADAVRAGSQPGDFAQKAAELSHAETEAEL